MNRALITVLISIIMLLLGVLIGAGAMYYLVSNGSVITTKTVQQGGYYQNQNNTQVSPTVTSQAQTADAVMVGPVYFPKPTDFAIQGQTQGADYSSVSLVPLKYKDTTNYPTVEVWTFKNLVSDGGLSQFIKDMTDPINPAFTEGKKPRDCSVTLSKIPQDIKDARDGQFCWFSSFDGNTKAGTFLGNQGFMFSYGSGSRGYDTRIWQFKAKDGINYTVEVRHVVTAAEDPADNGNINKMMDNLISTMQAN